MPGPGNQCPASRSPPPRCWSCRRWPSPSAAPGSALGNRTLIADSAETAFCALTSAATLLGVGLNAWAGWWWADPAAALVIAALAVKEGLEAWEDDD